MIVANHTAVREKERSRWIASLILVVAGSALLASLAFPIWRITLDAPQYPEGMGMLIWPKTITGENPHDLHIINELNHYIGMKKIEPESIPELKFIMPIIFFFGILSFAAAIRPEILPVSLLLGGLSLAGAAGMADFWKWEYDYGHVLDPTAAIKVPGMTYQPPLIGEAKLLNFLSTSWPATGGYLLFAAGALIGLALAVLIAHRFGWIGNASHAAAAGSRRKGGLAGRAFPLLALLAFGIGACRPGGPAPIAWGEDACHYCKMTLVQKGFAAERINGKGKAYKFDSIACLLDDLEENPLRSEERIFVSDWSRPETDLIPAAGAVFLKGGDIPSPMGNPMAGFASRDSASAFHDRTGGEIVEWARLKGI
jgi:copper chaperone NosL